MAELRDKVERVKLLLVTLNDPYPTPRSALVSDPGPSPSRYVPCDTCRSTGWIRKRGGYALCLVCDGQSWKRRDRGEPAWDAYLQLPVEVAVSLPQAAPRPPVEQDDSEPGFTWERLREAYDRSGSYGELRRWLDWLSSASPHRYRLVRGVLVEQTVEPIGAHVERELDLGVMMIALRMRTVRVPRWVAERAHADERRAGIAELAAAGMAAGEIARRVGMSKRAVRRKLAGIQVGSRRAGASDRTA